MGSRKLASDPGVEPTMKYYPDLPGYVFCLLRQTRPDIWLAAAILAYIGWAVSSRNMIPSVEAFIAMIIMGFGLGGSTLMLNEYWDMISDQLNPRKQSYSGLLKGYINPGHVLNLGILLAGISICLSIMISLNFTLIASLCIALSLMYSHPSIKLKSKPGMDILTNMLGLGILTPLAGWSIHQPLLNAPFAYFLMISLVIGELYVLFLLLDYESDLRSGINTLAVKLGFNKTIILGALLSMAASSWGIALALMNYIHDLQIISRVSPTLLLPPALYLWFTHHPKYENIMAGIVSISLIRLLGVMLFLLYYSGIWIL